jgi:hypothetical protein
MKTITLCALLAALLSACGTTSEPIVQNKEIAYMTRSEVSSAIQECEGAGQRATVVYTRADWRGKSVPVPVDVQCLPKPRGAY